MGVEKLKKRIDTLEWRYREMKRGCSTFRKAKPGPQKEKTTVWPRNSKKSGPQKKKVAVWPRNSKKEVQQEKRKRNATVEV